MSNILDIIIIIYLFIKKIKECYLRISLHDTYISKIFFSHYLLAIMWFTYKNPLLCLNKFYKN
jgi:hypothetical protein